MFKLTLSAVLFAALPALAANSVTAKAAKTAYASGMSSGRPVKRTFIKFSGAALAQYQKQVRKGGGSADTIVYRLPGNDPIAKNTAMIETDSESISYFTIVKTKNTRASQVLATGYNGASGKLTWRK